MGKFANCRINAKAFFWYLNYILNFSILAETTRTRGLLAPLVKFLEDFGYFSLTSSKMDSSSLVTLMLRNVHFCKN